MGSCPSTFLWLFGCLAPAGQAAALRISECLHVDTHFIKSVQTALFGILGKKHTFIYAAFHPSCINVAVKRKSFQEYRIGERAA